MSTEIKSGLQLLLRRAAEDEALRDDLLSRRDLAAAAAGVDLSPNERAVLRAAPADQLAGMIALLPAALERRAFLRGAGSVAASFLGGVLVLAPEVASARVSPPTGVRPDPPYFTGDADVVRYQTISGPTRALPDGDIERRIAGGSAHQLPRLFEGTFGFTIVVHEDGRVLKVTPGKHPAALEVAVAAMAVDLRWVKLGSERTRSTLSFDVVLARRPPLRDWSGRIALADLDVAGPRAQAVRRAVRALTPKLLAALKDPTILDPARAGKVRYAFRIDPAGVVVDPQITKNTSVQHQRAMAIRQLLAETQFPKAVERRWCRFSIVLPPST
jgi:hypothetical protein